MTRTFRNVLADPPVLAAAITIGDTTATLATDPGNEMPTTVPFSITIDDEVFTNASRAGTALTLGNPATAAHAIGAEVIHAFSRADSEAMVQTDDSRLTDARTPTAHAASHATAGSDPVSPSDIGAATSGHNHSGVYDPAGSAAAAQAASQPVDADLAELAAIANVQGDLAYTNAGPTWARLPKGTSGQVLKSGAADIAWETLANQLTADEYAAVQLAFVVSEPISSGNPLIALDYLMSVVGTANVYYDFADSEDTGSFNWTSAVTSGNPAYGFHQITGSLKLSTAVAATGIDLRFVVVSDDPIQHISGHADLPNGTRVHITSDSQVISYDAFAAPDAVEVLTFDIEVIAGDSALTTAGWDIRTQNPGDAVSINIGSYLLARQLA